MARGPMGSLARLLEGGSVAGLTDSQLLDRFASRGGAGAEAAFEALVIRHGPMVARVCRQSLRDPHDVEDAFQATFLVLVRRADSIGERDLLGPWLYGVAHRVARKARAVAGRRRGREAERAGFDPPARLDLAARVDVDLAPVLHEEVNRLPAKYRQPVILCHLQGLTHAEAAHELAWPIGTVSVRLARARKILADRLTRRGITTASVATVTATLTAEASAALVAPSWIHTVAIATLATSTGLPLTTAVSVGALALARRTSMTMFLSPWKWLAIPTTAAALTTAAGVGLIGSSPGQADNPQQPPTPVVARPAPDQTPTPAVKLSGPGPVIEQDSDEAQDLEADNMVINGKVSNLAKMAEALQKTDPTASYQIRLSGGTIRYQPTSNAAQFTIGSAATTQASRPQLAVKLDGPRESLLGQRYEYLLTVTNSGTTVVNAVQISAVLPREGGMLANLPLPPGARFVQRDRTLIWTVGELQQQKSLQYRFLYDATSPGRYHCVANVEAEPFRATDELETVVSEQISADKPPIPPERVEAVQTAENEVQKPFVAVPPAILGANGQGELGDIPANYFTIPAPEPGTPGSPRPVQIGQTILVEVLEALPGRPITGERIVRNDGTISLEWYGDLHVAGLNRDQIKAKVLEKLRVVLPDSSLGLVVLDGSNKIVAVPLERNGRVYIDDQPTPESLNDQGDNAQSSTSRPRSPQQGSDKENAPQTKESSRPADLNPAADRMAKFIADHPLPTDYFDLAKLPKRAMNQMPILHGRQQLQVEVLEALPGRPISGTHVIRTDGTISLGFYGDLMVAGYNRDQIKVKLLERLNKTLPPNILGLYRVSGPNLDQVELVPPLETNRVFVDESMNFAPVDEDLRAQIQALSAKIDRLTGSAPNPTLGPPASPSSTP